MKKVRFVDADKILEKEEAAFKQFFSECRSSTVAMYVRSVHKAFREIVNNAATVRVAPIVCARWEINCDGYYPYCTACGEEPPSGEMTNFCPHCGANMKKRGK